MTNISNKRSFFVRNLRHWYRANGRNFPWRRTHDPYKILISEYLLQQTNADLALPAYRSFLKNYPAVSDLARAHIRDLRRIIQPIGLAYRADRLKILGKQIMVDFKGQIPPARQDLLKLHGVGLYMSNAVLCFAYDKRVPVLDTNTIRVFNRVFDIRSALKRPRTDKNLETRMEEYLPGHQIREFNYALLDFGALVCTFKNPKCSNCPLNRICTYYKIVSEKRSRL